jgi:hypothetical protein
MIYDQEQPHRHENGRLILFHAKLADESVATQRLARGMLAISVRCLIQSNKHRSSMKYLLQFVLIMIHGSDFSYGYVSPSPLSEVHLIHTVLSNGRNI